MAMLWRGLTFIKSVPAVGTKRWEMTLVSKVRTVNCVMRCLTPRKHNIPQYQIRKDKKAGILISPSKVTVVGPVEEQDELEMSPDTAHAQERIVAGAFPVSDQTSTGDVRILNY